MRTYDELIRERNRIVEAGLTRTASDLQPGTAVFVIGLSDGGIHLRESGVFLGSDTRQADGWRVTYITMQVDGTDYPTARTANEAGFFEPETSMVLVVESLEGILVDEDHRTELARATEKERTAAQ